MRAVIVVVLPDMPDEIDGELAAMMRNVGSALDVPELRERVRPVIAIRETAEAVLRAVEPPGGSGSG